MSRNIHGFTLIEIIMVIVILAAVGTTAMSIFVDLRNEAQQSAEINTVGGHSHGSQQLFFGFHTGSQADLSPYVGQSCLRYGLFDGGLFCPEQLF